MATRVKDGYVVATLAALIFMMPTASQAQTITEARRIAATMYQRSDAAVKRKDEKALVSLLAPNYRVLDINKKTFGRPRAIHNIEAWFKSSRRITVKTSVVKVQTVNRKILVTVRESTKALFVAPRTGRTWRITVQSLFRDTWIKKNGRWLKEATTALRRSATVNGKPWKTY